MRRVRSRHGLADRLGIWLWGAIAVVLVVVLVVVVVGSRDSGRSDVDAFADITATALDRLGQRGTTDGEGLTPVALSASSGIADTTDGGTQVPTGTVDGPGRRIFGGVTLRLPRGGPGFVLRQIVPADLSTNRDDGAFVRWDGYVAILGPRQAGSGALPARLIWQKAEREGVTVPAGATVRLRTLFRIPASAGRCVGRTLPAEAKGHRAREVIRRAPAWLVRRQGVRGPWSWLRAGATDLAGLPAAVRTGPLRAVTFRGSHVCVSAQTAVTVEPDPDGLDAAATTSDLPVESPDGY
jgi:hypothetical protein